MVYKFIVVQDKLIEKKTNMTTSVLLQIFKEVLFVQLNHFVNKNQ